MQRGDWVKELGDFGDFITMVEIHAPDEFPEEDYLSKDEQLDLARAFQELRIGLAMFKEKCRDREKVDVVEDLLNKAEAAYQAGDDVRGARTLERMRRVAFNR